MSASMVYRTPYANLSYYCVVFPCPPCLKTAEEAGVAPAAVIYCPLAQVIFPAKWVMPCLLISIPRMLVVVTSIIRTVWALVMMLG